MPHVGWSEKEAGARRPGKARQDLASVLLGAQVLALFIPVERAGIACRLILGTQSKTAL